MPTVRRRFARPSRATAAWLVAGSLAGGVFMISACGGGSSTPATTVRTPATVPVRAASHVATPAVPAVPAVDPGTLPQTTAEPGFGAGLQRQMNVLWSAIVANSSTQARQVFFPRSRRISR